MFTKRWIQESLFPWNKHCPLIFPTRVSQFFNNKSTQLLVVMSIFEREFFSFSVTVLLIYALIWCWQALVCLLQSTDWNTYSRVGLPLFTLVDITKTKLSLVLLKIWPWDHEIDLVYDTKFNRTNNYSHVFGSMTSSTTHVILYVVILILCLLTLSSPGEKRHLGLIVLIFTRNTFF